MNRASESDRCRTVAGTVLAGLAMSVGWGFRGDYGHEAGAMVPGALLGLAVCIASGRADWRQRGALMGMAGAIGWAFGGQMSYGRIIGYTAASSFPDVLYGYTCLFVIGGLWAGIGSAILGMSVTQPRSYLEQFARPLIALWLVWTALDLTGLSDRLVERWYLHDTDWVAASSALLVAGACAMVFPRDRGACGMIAALAAGWWIGYLVFVVLLGLHMTPPRSDNWAGCVGLFISLIAYLLRRRDRTAVMLAGWGVLIGGVSFVLGDFVNMLGRAQWGPIGRYEMLQGLDYWKWMEQSFGLIMGLGVSAAFLWRIRPRLSLVPDDSQRTRLRIISLLFLLVVMMWANLHKNVIKWTEGKHIPLSVLGVNATWWFLIAGVLLSTVVIVGVIRLYRGRLPLAPGSDLGQVQMLFLIVLWVPIIGAFTQAMPNLSNRGVFLVQASFWITAGLCSLLVVLLADERTHEPLEPNAASDTIWSLGRRFWVSLILMLLILCTVAYLTVRSHEKPLPGSHLRFSQPSAGVPCLREVRV